MREQGCCPCGATPVGRWGICATCQDEIVGGIINTPEVEDFLAGVAREAAHQHARWGAAHDDGKTPFDWFWLIGYLAQKAAFAATNGDLEKARHHTITTAAALFNWHVRLVGPRCRSEAGDAAK